MRSLRRIAARAGDRQGPWHRRPRVLPPDRVAGLPAPCGGRRDEGSQYAGTRRGRRLRGCSAPSARCAGAVCARSRSKSARTRDGSPRSGRLHRHRTSATASTGLFNRVVPSGTACLAEVALALGKTDATSRGVVIADSRIAEVLLRPAARTWEVEDAARRSASVEPDVLAGAAREGIRAFVEKRSSLAGRPGAVGLRKPAPSTCKRA